MANNANFTKLEPQAWTEVARMLPYPTKPLMRLSATTIAGANMEGLVAQKNKTVKVPRPVRVDKSNVQTYDPANEPTATTLDVNNADLVIDTHEVTKFFIDKEDQKFSLPELVRMYLMPHLDIHAQKINDKMWEQTAKFEAAFFDNNSGATVLDDSDVRFARRTLLKRKFVSPTDGFVSILDPDEEDNLGSLSIFQQADSRGDASIQREGSMGRFAGFDFFLDNLGYAHGAASVDSGDRVAGLASVGDLTVTIDDGAGGAPASTFSKGDLIYFGSADAKDQIYAVESFASGVITLQEPLRYEVADNATIVAVPAGSTQLFYHPDSIALVTAGMDAVASDSRISRSIGFDPTNNMNYTLTIDEDWRGATVYIETLYGAQNFYEDWGIRYIAGTAAKA